jgi:hypothetical protein
MMKKYLLSTLIFGAMFAPIAANAASSCADLQPSFIDKLATKICDQLDMTTPTIDQLKAAKNPLVYTNPDTVGCDLGLSMPGLPAFGTNITGLDACSILKAVTGKAVSDANTAMKSGLDTALSQVKQQTGLSSGTTSINVSSEVGSAVDKVTSDGGIVN